MITAAWIACGLVIVFCLIDTVRILRRSERDIDRMFVDIADPHRKRDMAEAEYLEQIEAESEIVRPTLPAQPHRMWKWWTR